MPVDFLSEAHRAAYSRYAESCRPSNSLGTFISTPTGNCASYGTRTLGLRRIGCSRSEALSVHFCSIATQTPTMAGVHATSTLPITAAFFYGSRMGGIYVPPKHRIRPAGGQQSGAEGKAPEKPKDHPRRD